MAILNGGRNRDGGAIQPDRRDWSLVLDFKIPVKTPWAGYVRGRALIHPGVPHLIEGMLVHPYTKETVKMFLDGANKAEKVIESIFLFPFFSFLTLLGTGLISPE